MKQLTQKLGSGEMKVLDVPTPQMSSNMILVENYYSVISAGTEGSTVSTARKSLLQKAKEKPKLVKQVLQTLKSQGPLSTYRAVNKKLDSYSPLGYSSAGKVVAVGDEIKNFKVGDLVACAGVGYANHAEFISVPENLCVKVNNKAKLKEAAYNTLGAISLQSVRQCDLKLGESCVVIGLGILGQLTSMLLKASGVKVIGIDINKISVDFALKNNSIDFGFVRDSSSIEEKIYELTNGRGADGIIIAAGTKSNDPINLAGSVCRKKGTVVILGAVSTDFDRDPHWYRKELELKMACSYGPGRYDINYEENGMDYPYGYVRWTENRNMQAFQELICKSFFDLSFITTHTFKLKDAKKAYDLILSKDEFYLGLVIEYDKDKKFNDKPIPLSNKIKKNEKLNVSFIGAGSYAQGNLLPNLPSDINRIGVLTNSGTTSKRVAEKYKFKEVYSKDLDVFNDEANTIFIATRHDSHAEYVKKGLNKNKNIFVEKPLCLNLKELDDIKKIIEKKNSNLMVGFNRRFSPFAKKIKNQFKDGKMTMLYRINAGNISPDSWIQNDKIGGGRVVGEVCHFIDFMIYINGSLPNLVSANSLDDINNLNDSLNISIKFKNGSIGIISYYANGNTNLPKEYIEINHLGSSAIINDFKELKIYTGNKKIKSKLLNQDKGQKQMVKEFFDMLQKNEKLPISFNETYATTLSTFLVLKSLKNEGKSYRI